MKTALISALATLVALSACQKQQTEEERKAEIEREVQDRLAAEHQTQQQEQLAQRERDLDAREKALADKQAAAAANEEPSSAPRHPRSQADSAYDRGPTASYNLFYTRLEPYGSWLETRDYGYVWQPRDAGTSTWRPYLNGHWVYTDAGWTWVSEEPFGWATYHYGRWTRLRNIGWIWVPGEEWASAWVSWRKSDDYVGWAPLPPEAHFDRRSGIRNWADNYYDIGPTQYCFVPTSQFGTTRIEQTVVPPEQNVTIINRTTNVTNITYNNVTVVNQGPNYDELRSRTQQPIPRLKLERQVSVANTESQRPIVRGETIQMIAPVVQRAQAVERPRDVRQNITEATVERGWSDVRDPEAARQARAKMKSEATPPPDAPPKIVAKSSESAVETQGAVATERASSPEVRTQSARGTSPPVTPQPTSESKSVPMNSPSATPARTASPIPSAAPSSSVPSRPDARAAVTPSPSAEENQPLRVGGRLKSQAKRFNPSNVEPMPPNGPQTDAAPATRASSPGPTQSPSANPDESGQRSVRQRPEGMRRRSFPERQPGRSPTESSPNSTEATSPAQAASPSPAAKPTASP